MNERKEILEVSRAKSITHETAVQSLWSGYGEIKRYFLKGGKIASVIAKRIQMQAATNHPRGWNTDFSHQRKIKSYQVEKNWYQSYSNQTNSNCRVPACYKILEVDGLLLLIMEDLNASGFHLRIRPDEVTLAHAKSCLAWLAAFHSKFMHQPAEGLWSIGTYWHLDTRPDELEKMQNIHLKQVASEIDSKLNNAKHQTLVHGDAKLANFCFDEFGKVAAVDFQYVGKGCGIKDVVYLISSCFDDYNCEKYEEELLAHYFDRLEIAMNSAPSFHSIKKEWLQLYQYAWADFYRFLDGWNPGHWKMHRYSERLTRAVIKELAH